MAKFPRPHPNRRFWTALLLLVILSLMSWLGLRPYGSVQAQHPQTHESIQQAAVPDDGLQSRNHDPARIGFAALQQASAPTLQYSVVPNQQQVNESFTFTLRVTNPEDGAELTSVSITDTFPDTITINQVQSGKSGGTINTTDHGYTVSFDSIAVNETFNITIDATVNPTAISSQTLTSIAEMTYTVDTTQASVQSNEISFSIIVPAVELVYGVTPSQQSAGGEFTFALSATNNGDAPITGITLSDTFPDTLTLTSVVTDVTGATVDFNDQSYTVEIASLDVGASVNMVIKATVDAGITSQVTQNTRAQMVYTTDTTQITIQSNIVEFTLLFIGTDTPTPTITSTPTPTVTGTPPTPTATGTITPSPRLIYSVSPRERRVNQEFIFTLQVSNQGLAPATNVTISDSFPTYLTLGDVTTTRGTATRITSTRTFTVRIDELEPGETATITVEATVNTTATSNLTLSTSADMTYTFDGSTRSAQSNTVSYRIIATTTLPGTGGMELPTNQDSPPTGGRNSGLFVAGMIITILLSVSGLSALFYSRKIRLARAGWSDWFLKMGMLLVTVAVIFGLMTWGIKPDGSGSSQIAGLMGDVPGGAGGATPTPFIPNMQLEDSWPSSGELEELPDYPIPTPSIAADQGQEETLDTSAITRIRIPVLGVDTEVKYVPFDGLTWLIEGLQKEVAWLGETSWPGLGSNTVLAGHVTLRTGGNGPFRYLEQLNMGDQIVVYTQEKIYTYVVRDVRVVEETDTTIINDTDDTQLTLITCTEWDQNTNFYLKRLVAQSNLIEVKPLFDETVGN